MDNLSLPQEIRDHILAEAEKEGFLLVDIVAKAGRVFSIEVLLDKEGGISLDECGAFNRKISSWLEETGGAGQNFIVDVCSPGLDRALKKTQDFLWARGREIKISLHAPLEGKSAYIGKLVDVSGDDAITIESEEGPLELERDKVAGARLWLGVNIKKKNKKSTKRSKKKK